MKTANPAIGAVGVPIDMAGEPIEPAQAHDAPVAPRSRALSGERVEPGQTGAEDEAPSRAGALDA